jgi:hypothetical protein
MSGLWSRVNDDEKPRRAASAFFVVTGTAEKGGTFGRGFGLAAEEDHLQKGRVHPSARIDQHQTGEDEQHELRPSTDSRTRLSHDDQVDGETLLLLVIVPSRRDPGIAL